MSWFDEAINDYFNFLKENTFTSINTDSDWILISTPFLGMYNDHIEIFCKKEENDTFILSDDGKTLHDLELCGLNLARSPKRKELINRILLNYDVRLEDGELIVNAIQRNFPQKKHNLISAIMEITDMHVLASPNIISIFSEDVKKYLDEQEIIYTPKFISKGSTGLEFTFDFQIAYRNHEIVINNFNRINNTNLAKFLFSWDDIKQTRQLITDKEIISLAIINNDNRIVGNEYLDALRRKGSDYILWNERYKKENLNKLQAKTPA